ncbi:MAG: hypothetical protein ABWX85_01965 [Arthrobacter sp.]
MADFAIWFAGGVPVPIHESSSARQVEWILNGAGGKDVTQAPLP